MKVNRRSWIVSTTLACASSCFPRTSVADDSIAFKLSDDHRKRLACTTVCFRNWFAATRGSNADSDTPTISINEIPELFARELDLCQVEVWSKHLGSPDNGSCQELARAASDAGSSILNIQLDENVYTVKGESGAEVRGVFNLSASSSIERERSIEFTKRWMDGAAQCGAYSLRANTGKTGGKVFDMEQTADSFRQLAVHGHSIGVKILIENHGPNIGEPDRLAKLVRLVDHPYCRTLPDFGNIPNNSGEAFREWMLQTLVPTAQLISAKTSEFNAQGMHTAYDFEQCVRISEQLGYRGVYSAEFWNPSSVPFDPIAVAQSTLRLIANNLRSSD